MSTQVLRGSDDLILFQPKLYEDNRGLFLERFNSVEFHKITRIKPEFVQMNESFSTKGVLRGLHYQLNRPQGKLISIIAGKVLDVVVDLRKHSSNFGKSFAIELDSIDKNSLWIPRGYAHGFLALTDNVTFFYMVDNHYDPSSEHTLLWNDPVLKIDWNIKSPIVSSKDAEGLTFKDAPKFS